MSATAGATPAGRLPASATRHRRVFLPVLAALVALAWVALWAWARSPFGRYLEHADWTASGPAAFLCRVVPAGDVVVPMVLYATAWILMTAAMMLPTTLPLFNTFDRLTAQRPDHGRLLMLLGLGYMTVWGAFGLLAHALHSALLSLLASVPTLAWHGWLIGAATIALAGAFQFSRLKYRCLEKCRTPLSFLTSSPPLMARIPSAGRPCPAASACADSFSKTPTFRTPLRGGELPEISVPDSDCLMAKEFEIFVALEKLC